MPSGIYIPNPRQKPTADEARASSRSPARRSRLNLFPRFDRHLRPHGRKA
jgi:hypothetical protein